ncbi:uncharacterized protein FOMMEDRAFT_122573 [Fomitiporia mediterranea MF3/22]|uniref:uncharacterized protein n=1 Tax=Fomitiporia mediterranea (strain MF3/22) TaxID=694068 RepID=UPI0004409B13|nr:uncharacterized protein FOMMEDRAFT_122573 [Fomitiporia mediterranea MF3/22]EJD02575.1 hypothetical protein FOMMEDRAFT_122573 [Fomitiporia mediterranea MF3/22]
MLNYWTKASLFANPLLRHVLLSSGNIPVERKSKDNRVLFKGTFEVLARGEAVALFPEGTSYTEPRIMQVKDGASWSALEYMKWAKENPDKATSKELVVVPAAIVYTNKSKYRSEVIIEFGEPISLKQYEAQFLSPIEGEPRIAVKRLTQRIEAELIRATINAPDWDTLYVARMARSLLWEKSKSIDLNDFVTISQTLVDLFSTPDATTNTTQVKRRLLEYYSLLQSSKLNNSALSSLPLPKTLDPRRPEPLPSRLRTLLVLWRDTLSVLVRLPFFLFPLLVHLPAYLASRAAARLVEDEEETQAQNKVVVGLILMIMIYPAAFLFLWALFWYTPVGAVVAATTVWLFAVYHVKMIDNVYDHAKQLVAAWRVLVGIWSPRKTELSMTALQQYLVPKVPPESPWIDKNKKVKQQPESESQSPLGQESSSAGAGASSLSSTSASLTPTPNDKFNSKGRKRRPPTRRLIRHVLRARSQAVHALAAFFAELERQPEGKRVYASAHLAQLYGGFSEASPDTKEDPTSPTPPKGWRSSREVLTFLRTRGARIATLESQIAEDYWAASSGALLSDGDVEGEGGEGETEYSYNSYSSDAQDSVKENEGDEDIKWVAPMIR